MARTGKLRLLVVGLLLAGLLVCLGGAVYLGLAYGRTASRPPPPAIRWTTLPVPVRRNPDWTSFTNTQTVNDALWYDGFIWAATSGGAVVWDAATEEAAKFTVEHGLAGNRVSSVTAAPDGAIWFGAAGGVSRYDGRAWTTFTQDDGLPANEIRDILATPDGRIWVATPAGVARYDGRAWTTFNRVRSLFQLPSDDVRALAAGTAPGTIWAATSKGVAYYDGRRWQDYSQTGSQAINDARDVAVTAAGEVWAATAGGLKRLDGEQWQLFTSEDGLAANEIRRLAPDGSGALWLAYDDPARGLTRFDATTGIPVAATETAPGPINALAPTPDGLLIATNDGLYRRGGGQTRPFPHPDDFPLNPARDLAWGSGAVWLGGQGGAARFDGANWQPYGPAEGLTAAAISRLFTGAGGQIWAAYDRPAQGASYFQGGAWRPFACPPAGPPSDRVRGAVLADDGRIWFATSAGVAVTNGQSWDILNAGLPSTNVQTIARGPDGRIWAGTNAGLAVWENGAWRSRNQDDVRELSIGPDGVVWYITASDVKRLAGETTTIIPAPPVSQVYDFLAVAGGFWLAAAEGAIHYTENGYQTYPGLAGTQPTALLRGADGAIWAAGGQQATSSHSDYGSWQANFVTLSRFDGQAWQSQLLSNPTGPNHAAVTAILPAPDGRVWLGTLGGVSRFDGETWQAWNRLSGLPDDAILDLAWGDGAVWAVTPQGLARYAPETDRWLAAAELAGVWRVPGNVTLAAAPDGTLWAAAEGAVRHLSGGAWRDVPLTLPHPAAGIRAIAVAGDGRLWAAAYANAETIPEAERHYLGVYDGGTWRWQRLDWPSGGGRAAVDWLTFAPNGTLWLGTSAGLWTLDTGAETAQPARWPVEAREAAAVLFDGAGRGWTGGRFQPALIPLDGGERLPIPLPQAGRVYALAQAADGAIWVGTDGGAARRRPDGNWELFYGPDAAAAQLPTTLFAGEESLWLGTFGGAVWRVADGRAQEIWPPALARENPVSALLRDGAGALWLGSFGGGAARRDGRSWTTFRAQPDLFQARVAAAAAAPDGTVWLGTDRGLFTIGGAADNPACRFEPAGREILAQALAADPPGNIWAVSEGTLWRGDASGFDRAATLVQPVVTVAPDGAIWFVAGETLVREMNGRRQEIALAGLPGEVTDIAWGPGGRIWLGSTAGAAVREEGRWRRLTTRDGLGNDWVWRVRPLPDGSVWFLTGGGVSWLRP